MALLVPPKFLILDEPFSGVDPMGKEQMCNLLKEIPELTLLFTVHKIEEA